MADALDMSLDEIIKINKKSGGSSGNVRNGGRGRGGSSSGSGPTRRSRNHSLATPYFVPQAAGIQKLLMREGSSSDSGTKLYISNLDCGVTNEDIKVLLSDVGDLKRYSIHYDKSGRSKGSAEVVYVHRADALAAMRRFNNVHLDGKPMKLELVGVEILAPIGMPVTSDSILGKPSGISQSVPVRSSGRGMVHGAGVRRFGKGFQDRRGRGEKVSTEDLDTDLERYHLEAMQIS